MRKVLIGFGVATATALSLAVPASAQASLAVLSAASYSSTVTPMSGVNWLRTSGDSATWTFNTDSLSGAERKGIYLNVSALVTNKDNGGSGFSARAVKFVATCGSKSQRLEVSLRNPFRPVVKDNTFGIGYAAYGSSSSPLRLDKLGSCSTITITAKAPFPSDRHIGFTDSSVKIAFT